MVTAHMAYVFVIPRLFTLHASGSPGRLTLDAVGIIVTVAFGYTSFLRFISVTATRYVRAQAEIDLARDIHRVLVPAVETDWRLRVSRPVTRERLLRVRNGAVAEVTSPQIAVGMFRRHDFQLLVGRVHAR